MIAIIGCGTLGSRLAERLTRHELLLVDHDTVHPENLLSQRFTANDLGKSKSEALQERLGGRSVRTFVDVMNADILSDTQIVCDCTDNLWTRRVLSRWCLENGVPLVHAAAGKERGVAAVFYGKPCLECVYGKKVPVEACRGSDIDAALADTLAAVQARLTEEALADKSPGKELILVRSDKEQTVSISRESCAVCAPRPIPTLTEENYLTWCPTEGCFALKPRKKSSALPGAITVGELTARRLPDGEIRFPQGAKVEDIEAALSTDYRE